MTSSDSLIARLAWLHLRSALLGWQRGQVVEEVALLNRIIESMSLDPVCKLDPPDYGFVTSEWYVLHRKGPGGTDLYGSDIAVTVWKAPSNWLKTAFIQLKASSNYAVQVEPDQLLRAKSGRGTWERSFIAAANAGNADLRVTPCAAFDPFSMKAGTKSCRASRWLPAQTWIEQWLRCDVGLASTLPYEAEASLLDHVRPVPLLPDIIPQDRESRRDNDVLPARAWLVVAIEGVHR